MLDQRRISTIHNMLCIFDNIQLFSVQYNSYSWAMPKHIEFAEVLASFYSSVVIKSTTNHGTMTLRYWGGVLWIVQVIYYALPDLSGIFWITMWIDVAWIMYMSGAGCVSRLGRPINLSMLNLIIKLHSFCNVSMLDQRRKQLSSIKPIVHVW